MYWSRVVQQGNSLLVFKWGNPVTVHRLDLSDPEKPHCTALLELYKRASGFAVANYKDLLVYLTGSSGEVGKFCQIYDIIENSWKDGPALCHARYNHASMCLGYNVYVFGGVKVGSIETHRAGSEDGWKVLYQTTRLTNRFLPAIAVIRPNTIAIFGGYRDGYNMKDGYIFDTKQKSVKPLQGNHTENLEVEFSSHVKQISSKSFVTVGVEADGKINLVQIDLGSVDSANPDDSNGNDECFSARSVKNFGKNL